MDNRLIVQKSHRKIVYLHLMISYCASNKNINLFSNSGSATLIKLAVLTTTTVSQKRNVEAFEICCSKRWGRWWWWQQKLSRQRATHLHMTPSNHHPPLPY